MEALKQLNWEDDSKYVSSKDQPSEADLWKGDAEGCFCDLAKDLTSLVMEQNNPVTICLNGDWGTGKTFFLSRLVEQYKLAGRSALYYDAWKDDFSRDPLVAILSNLSDSGIAKKHIRSVWKAAKPVVASVGLGMAKRSLKEKLCLDISELTLSDAVQASEKAADAFEEYRSLVSLTDSLRQRLTIMADDNWKKTHAPLLIVIDELDRCRPSFAMELLERIKYLFGVKRIVFIVGTNRQQLEYSIKAIYGEIDATEYLNRFFDLNLSIPQIREYTYLDILWRRLNVGEMHFRDGKTLIFDDKFKKVLLKFMTLAGLTLRQIEHCVRVLPLVKAQILRQGLSNRVLINDHMLCAGLMLSVLAQEKAQKFYTWELSLNDLLAEILRHPSEGISTYSDVIQVIIATYATYAPRKKELYDALIGLKSPHKKQRSNVKAPIPDRLLSMPEDDLSRLVECSTRLVVDRDRAQCGVIDCSQTFNILHYALMLT